MGNVRKALIWSLGALAVTLVPMYIISRNPGLEVPLPYWIFAGVTSGGVSFLMVLLLVVQSDRLRIANEELRAAQSQLRHAAESDHLTAVLNRAAFLRKVRAHHAIGEGWMLLLDIDHFKTINDRFGHEAGDDALRHVACVLRESLRAGDLVGRLGGEEFGIYLPDADRDRAVQIADRVRRNVETSPVLADAGFELTVSIGLAGMARGDEIEEGLRRADFAMYDAKNSGRNRISLNDAALAPHSAASNVSAA